MNSIKLKRRNFFYYLTAGAASAYALTKMPFKIFQSKVSTASKIKVTENPFAVKRDSAKIKSSNSKGSNNG